MAPEGPGENSQAYPPLDRLLSPETVRCRIRVGDWHAAVQAAGELLVASGSARPAYIQAMERAILELGPYIVIAPGIALLHARPEDGVLQPGMALVTLAPPVCFGHTENDPVAIVVALGATDKESHIQALMQLAGLLNDPASVDRLRAAPDEATLLAVIRAWMDKERPVESQSD